MERDLRMYKWPLFDVVGSATFDDAVSIEMQPSTGVQFVGIQNGVVTLWCVVDRNAPKIKRTFHIAGTGHLLPAGPCYLGSVFDRQFVWHIFETFLGAQSL